MFDDVLTQVHHYFSVLTDDRAPQRVSVGFAENYRQHAFVQRWLDDHDLYRAIDTTRRAVQLGRLDESHEALAERERVRQIDSVEQFVAERTEARRRYDACCTLLGEVLGDVATLSGHARLGALVDYVAESKALDEHLHAYIVNYNRPNTLIARRLEQLAARGRPASSVTIPGSVPSYAIVEATFCITVAALVREGGTGEAGWVRARLDELADAQGIVGEVVRRGRWVFARGSTATLERKLTSSGWLRQQPDELRETVRRLLSRRERAQREATTANAADLPELDDIGTLLVFDHIEDALRSTVYNGLEDYVARCLLAEELQVRGILDTDDPMDHSQDQLLALAVEAVRPHRLTAKANEPRSDVVVRLGTDTLTRDELVTVARTGAAEVRLDSAAAERMRRSVRLRNDMIATGQPVYGVTTGFGASNFRQVGATKATALQRSLVRYHLVGTGEAASPDVVRATMLLRANCLARGYSGARPEVAQLLIDCLAADILPVVPERGSVGASGDLVPLCYVANMLVGDGDVRHRGTTRPAQEALRGSGLRPLELEPKEALALINGTSFMTAFGALAVHDATEIALVADVCTALTSEVLLGNSGHFEPFIHQQRPHTGQVTSASRIRSLLAGSRMTHDLAGVLAANPRLNGNDYLELVQPIQDRYSVRCAPHVIGVLYDTLDWVDRWLQVEMNSTNDNPLFDPETGSVYNGGNFYGGHVGHAMDALKLAVAQIGDLLDRQLALVVDEKFNNGLTPNLVPPFTRGDWSAGLRHGFKGVQIACSSLAAEALKLTAPATVFSRPTEAYNQDKVSMGTIAARDARTVVVLVREVAAMHLMALCQAADLRGPELLSPLNRGVYSAVRERVPFLSDDRAMDLDVAAVVELIASGEIGWLARSDPDPATGEAHITSAR